jgi:hypothetical protein
MSAQPGIQVCPETEVEQRFDKRLDLAKLQAGYRLFPVAGQRTRPAMDKMDKLASCWISGILAFPVI